MATPYQDPGPAPRRGRTGLIAQFVLQFAYLPVWGVLVALLTVLAVFSDSNASFDLPRMPPAISWRRLRCEWSGRADAWAPFTESLLQKRFPEAERTSGWAASKLPPSGVRRAVAELPVRHYRGLAPAQVDQLARRHGWSLDWRASSPRTQLSFERFIPPAPLVGIPDPFGPPPPPGTPWGPLPCRVLLPLLTYVLMPRLRGLELRRNPAAYLDHLRAHLPGLFTKELAKSPGGSHYVPDEFGRIMRRVTVHPNRFRAAGPLAVLRIASEHGWYLDPAYPAAPAGRLHLCRLDGPFQHG